MSYVRKHSKTGIYWYRRAIPPRLRGHLPHHVPGFGDKPSRTEFTKSLKTRDPREANRKAGEIDARVQAAIDQAEAAVARPQTATPAIAAPATHTYSRRDLATLIDTWRRNEIARQERAIFNSPPSAEPDRIVYNEAASNRDRNVALYEGRVDDVPGFYETMAEAIAMEGTHIEPDHPALYWLARDFAVAWLATIKARERLILGLPVTPEPEPETATAPATAPAHQNTSQPKIKNSRQSFLFKLNDWRAQAKLQPHQLAAYTVDIRGFSAIRPKMTIGDADLEAVQNWIATMVKADLAVKTIKRKLSAIRNYWRYLQTMGYVEPGPKLGQGAVLPRVNFDPTKEIRTHFDPVEIVQLWQSATAKNDQPLADAIRIAALTGARITSICEIKAADIKTVDGIVCIHFNDKTKAGNRHVPILPALQPAINRLIKMAGKDGYLFHTNGTNKRVGRGEAIRKRFAALARKTHNFPNTKVFHSVRKSVAHMLLHSNCEEYIAARLLGHEYSRMTYGLYAKASPPIILAAMETGLDYQDAAFMTAR